jgi:hypothetical protein
MNADYEFHIAMLQYWIKRERECVPARLGKPTPAELIRWHEAQALAWATPIKGPLL